MSTEYRLVTFRLGASQIIPPAVRATTVLTIDFLGSIPQLAEYMDGWEVVTSQIIPIGEDVMVTFTLKMNAIAPSTSEGIANK